MDRERIAYLKETMPGKRVVAVRFSTENSSVDDNATVPPGTKGTVGLVDDFGTIHVRWENGASLGLLLDQDEYRVLK